MTNVRPARLRTTSVLALLACAAVLSGCAGSGTAAPPPALAGLRTSAPPAAASPTAPAPSSSPTPAVRDADDLQRALLALDDLPSGFSVASDGDDPSVTLNSRAPGCAALVALLNAEHPPGSHGDAAVAFGGGSSGPYLGEGLAAFADRGRVLAAVRDMRDAVRSCDEVSIDFADGDGPLPFSVEATSAPDLGEDATAVRLTALDEETDLELDFVFVAADTVLLGTTGVAALPEDVEGFTTDAYDKLVHGAVGDGGSSSQPA